MKGLSLLLKNTYFHLYLIFYLVFFFLLSRNESFQMNEILAVTVIVGIIFSTIAYLLSRSAKPLFYESPSGKNEIIVIIGILLFFILFITFYVDILIPSNANELSKKWINGFSKITCCVLIPIIVYRLIYGFTPGDWGIKPNVKMCFSKNSIVLFIVLSVIIVLFQVYASNGFKPVREGVYSHRQVFTGIPLHFLWLIFTVGIVEEFFFRTFLQSRLSLLLKSQIGGIVLSAMFFGLAHAPGIYFRGGGEIASLGTNPSLLLATAYSFLALSSAGFFLSIIWLKTKNFWLIVAIHAMVDLLPGLSSFIDIFGL